MSPNPLNLRRNFINPVVVGCTGTGVTASAVFQKVFEQPGAPGLLVLALQNVVGDFSELQFNVEFSATQSAPYFEVVGTWVPLTNGIGFFPITEAGFYRLNCTEFTGGTSVDVYGTIGLPSGASSGGAGPSSDVTIVGCDLTLPTSANLNDGEGNPISSSGGSLDVNVTGGVSSGPYSTTGDAPAYASVGVSSAQVVASNASRKGLTLTNNSYSLISLAFGANAAVLGSGMVMLPGGTFVMDTYDFTTAAVNAIASDADGELAIQEFE